MLENDRVREMLEIAREASGKEYIIFIIDEVGQYVGPRPNLILNLDGLAKNLKNIGDGKVWIVGTAQQILTADDAKAALNSPELFKLNAYAVECRRRVKEQMNKRKSFREALEELLEEMGITLVFFVDDLDRCLPKTAISTLEAIRLLLFLRRSAFVIAANDVIIRGAGRFKETKSNSPTKVSRRNGASDSLGRVDEPDRTALSGNRIRTQAI